MPTKEEVQSWPEVPSVAHFCSLFRDTFDLLEFEIEELENGLLVLGSVEDRLQLVPRLIVKLLVGCLPGYKAKVDVNNVGRYLQQFFQTQQEEAEEDGVQMHIENPFEEEEEEWNELSLRGKVRVLRQLTQFRLEVEDTSDKLKNLDSDSLRVEPLGEDHLGTTYWYFYGTRLYKEVNPQKMRKVMMKEKKEREKKKEKKLGEKEKGDGEEGESQKVEKMEGDMEEMEEDGDSEEVEKFTGPTWSLVCSTEEEWLALADSYKKSRKKQDKELYETIAENFLPEISKMFATKEREEKMRLLMLAPKRTSSRIQVKRVIEESIKADEDVRKQQEREEMEMRKKQKQEEEASKDREWRKQQREQRLKEEEEERLNEEAKKREMAEGRAERAKERIREG